jgi:phospholipase/carboxylesterase
MFDLQTIEVRGWKVRYRIPEGGGPHPVIVLLHGWTGDEDSMWVFASRLPDDHLLLAPRGLYPSTLGGYAWHPDQERKNWPHIDDFSPAVEALSDLFDHWTVPNGDFSTLRLAGFSQGAALVYSFALRYPQWITALAGLAGFLPDGAAASLDESLLDGVPVYISHGIHDKLVPVARARQAVQLLKKAGAQVTYCESDVGHKLSAGCFNGMEVFFS